jgi:hypothetical protein
MTGEQIRKSRRRFEVVGALACTLLFGLLLWDRELPSAGPVTANDYLLLPAYLILTSTCYFGAFWLLHRLDPVSARELNLHWVYASVLGTSGSFVADGVRLWLSNRPDDLFGFVGAWIIFLGLFVALILLAMALVISAGAIYRLGRKRIDKGGRSAEAHGI